MEELGKGNSQRCAALLQDCVDAVRTFEGETELPDKCQAASSLTYNNLGCYYKK